MTLASIYRINILFLCLKHCSIMHADRIISCICFQTIIFIFDKIPYIDPADIKARFTYIQLLWFGEFHYFFIK